ncbi:hypothetical protein PQO03_07640 [Lentisphaera profundi]|uniref:Uncharacterized protein n=1 Tax=Lentisphaera profundi TaxID=1658616 RepID=A0ABY7VRV8_9BACT|nr:hypothetical protein [Lentisphaera profundi]WDE95591.1 hypothetical protein PQO03_07640 [Lentisphaera profundi]
MGAIVLLFVLILAPIFGVITASKTEGGFLKKFGYFILGLVISTVMLYALAFLIIGYLYSK